MVLRRAINMKKWRLVDSLWTPHPPTPSPTHWSFFLFPHPQSKPKLHSERSFYYEGTLYCIQLENDDIIYRKKSERRPSFLTILTWSWNTVSLLWNRHQHPLSDFDRDVSFDILISWGMRNFLGPVICFWLTSQRSTCEEARLLFHSP